MKKVINQGDIFWLDLGQGIIHPQLVIQDNIINHSRIDTVVVCTITTNRNKAAMPGNVVLEIGEGNLEKLSVVEVTSVWTVNKSLLTEFIGTLSEDRIKEIFNGMKFIQNSFSPPARE